MSSGPRGEEPINLSPNMRQHYARQLRTCGCSPRCESCRQAQGVLIAGGADIRDTSERTPPDRRSSYEPVEILLFVGLLAFALTCVWLTGGRR